jgi:hypothetical protein
LRLLLDDLLILKHEAPLDPAHLPRLRGGHQFLSLSGRRPGGTRLPEGESIPVMRRPVEATTPRPFLCHDIVMNSLCIKMGKRLKFH